MNNWNRSTKIRHNVKSVILVIKQVFIIDKIILISLRTVFKLFNNSKKYYKNKLTETQNLYRIIVI